MKRWLSILVVFLCWFPSACFASGFSEYYQNKLFSPTSAPVSARSSSSSSSYASSHSSTGSFITGLYVLGGLIVFGMIASVVGAVVKETKIENEKAAKEEERQKAKVQREIRQWQREQENILKRQQAERDRLEREKAMPAQRRFVAEQRRLMSDSLRYEVLRRDGFRCQICGATAKDGYKLHVDHIYPVSKGGKTELSNLRTLCERCNMGKSDKIEEASPDSWIPTYTPEEFADKFAK